MGIQRTKNNEIEPRNTSNWIALLMKFFFVEAKFINTKSEFLEFNNLKLIPTKPR